MASANTNRVKFTFLKETTFNVAPTAAFNELGSYVSDTLSTNTASRTSTSIRSDRQIMDVIRENFAPAGDVAFNLQIGNIDSFLEGLAMDVFSAPLAISGSIGVSGTANQFTTAAVGGVVFTPIKVGQWIKTGGFTNAANNGFFEVTAVNTVPDPRTITVKQTGVLVTEVAATGRTIDGSVLFNGTTPTSFSWEKNYTDLTNIFDSGTGFRVGKFELNLKTGAGIGGLFSFEGASMALTGATSIAGTTIAPPTNQEINANDHVTNVFKSGVASTFATTDLIIRISNALRGKGKIGKLGFFDIGIGSFTVEVDMTVFFEDRTLLDIARAFSTVGLAVQVKDDSGKSYIFSFPTGRLTPGDPVVPGKDNDVTLSFKFLGFIDATASKMMSISKF